MSNETSTIPMRAVPGYFSTTEGIQIAVQTSADATDEDLQFFQQLDIEWAMVGIRDPKQHSLDFYKRLVKRFGDFGIKIYHITNTSVENTPEITLNLPGRDEKIEEFKQFIRNQGAAGIRYHGHAHMANGIWSSGKGEGRGGMTARRLDLKDAVGYWDGKTYQGELTHGREYSEEELWENYAYMIREIAPVAEEAGVRIGFHPDDPPVYPMGGIPRCIFGTFEGYKKAMEIADSPNISVLLCIGCWLEGGDNDPVNQVAAMHLDMVSTSFGIQEENHFTGEELEVFPGHATQEAGYMYANDKPGLGIDIDEEKAARLLRDGKLQRYWMAEDRRADGSIVRP